MDDVERTEAASLLGKIGRLYRDPEVLDVRPIIESESHEMLGLKVTTGKGIFVVTVISAEDSGLQGLVAEERSPLPPGQSAIQR